MKLDVLGYELDKEQTKAALKSNCNTIIIAGAGAGKSTTMVGKIKYLVFYKHIPLENILCITFTNNAAQSLEEKIKKGQITLINVKSDGLWFGITYKEDLEVVKKEINMLIEKGEYPRNLWE